MIVPIFNSMSRIDRALFEAARDAGLGRLQTMLQVVVPLTKNGIALGSIFVVTLVMGDFYIVKVHQWRRTRLDRLGGVRRHLDASISTGGGPSRCS